MAYHVPLPLPGGELTRKQLIQALGACPLCDGRLWDGYHPADYHSCHECDGSGTAESWTCSVCETEYCADDALPWNVGQPGVCPDTLVCESHECVREALRVNPECLSGAEREWYEARQHLPLECVIGREW